MKTLALAVLAVLSVGSKADGGCWQYYDYASKYHLDHVASSYPWDEIKQAMRQNPDIERVLATGTKVPTSQPPDGHFFQAESVVCPSERFMLKAFQYDGKQCYVVNPEVQQVRYSNCTVDVTRVCHYCHINSGGISRCEEDYEWQRVWAYCRPVRVPNPLPPVPPPYVPKPKPYVPIPSVPVIRPQPTPQPRPSTPRRRPYVQPKQYQPKTAYDTSGVFARSATDYDPWRPANAGYYARYKRGAFLGQIEELSLYLPYQCSCKHFRC